VVNTIENEDEQKTGPGNEQKEIGALKALWDLFSSMKTAIVLLLVLAAVSIGITIYDARMGDTTGHNFQKPGYLLLLALIAVNLTVCSINRFQQAWRRTFSPSLRADPAQLKKAAASVAVTADGSLDEAAEKVERALRARRYTVTRTQQDKAVAMHATKGRLAIWGPYLTHLSILVIFVGAVFGARTGFDGYMNVAEGEKNSIYSNNKTGKEEKLPFDLGLRKFEIKYDEKRLPVGYKSDLQVYDGDKKVVEKIIDVNSPLTYKGITFFQSSYGLRQMALKVTSPKGQTETVTFNINSDGQNYEVTSLDGSTMPFETVNLDDKKLTIFAHNPNSEMPIAFVPDYVGGDEINASSLPLNPAVFLMVNERFPDYKGLDAWQKVGWLPINKSLTYKGYSITFDHVVQTTGLSIARNPGLPVIYFGFGLLVLGLFFSFYITHKIIRVHISTSGKKINVVAGTGSRADPSSFEKDLARLRSEVEA